MYLSIVASLKQKRPGSVSAEEKTRHEEEHGAGFV
jgi:hypothetical protein